MKLVLTMKEMKETMELSKLVMKSTGEVTEEEIKEMKMDSIEDIIEMYKKVPSKIMKVYINIKGEIVFKISEDYLMDFLKVYGTFLNTAIPQTIALFKTFQKLMEDSGNLTLKYILNDDIEECTENQL